MFLHGKFYFKLKKKCTGGKHNFIELNLKFKPNTLM